MGVLAKKSSKGLSEEVKDNQVEEHTDTDTAPIQSKKRRSYEIDDIFSSKKNKNIKSTETKKDVKGKNAGKQNKAAISIGAQIHTKSKFNKDSADQERRVKRSNKLLADGDLFGDSSKARKKSGGMKIYTEDELGLNRPDAGGTPLCPFDCDCCF